MVGMEGKRTLLMFLVGKDNQWLYVKPERAGLSKWGNILSHSVHYTEKALRGTRYKGSETARRETANRNTTFSILEALNTDKTLENKNMLYGLKGNTRNEYNAQIANIRKVQLESGGSEIVVEREDTGGITDIKSLVDFMHSKMYNINATSVAFIFPLASANNKKKQGLDRTIVNSWLSTK
eukprot:6175738-Pleurochrysis_carterae.AAC.1